MPHCAGDESGGLAFIEAGEPGKKETAPKTERRFFLNVRMCYFVQDSLILFPL